MVKSKTSKNKSKRSMKTQIIEEAINNLKINAGFSGKV